MKAVAGVLPPGDDAWAFEVKWDGMRILAAVDGATGTMRLESGRGLDATTRFPELEGLPEALAPHTALLDGEVVAFDADGRPSFGRLQRRMHVASAIEARRRAAAEPACYQVFDILRLDGTDLVGLPYVERRRVLAEVVGDGPAWRVPAYHVGDGDALLEAVRAQGLEGLVAKRLDSRYEPGRRSPSWRKIKARNRQEFVVGGWQPGEKGRAGRVGSLLLGYHDDTDGPERGALRYAGKVGTGFTSAELDRLDRILGEREVAEPPFTPLPPRPVSRLARWVRPELVAEIEFAEWTPDGILRHPSYLGLRWDKDPSEVTRSP